MRKQITNMLFLALALCATAAHAQPPPQDKDWPCAQRLVPTLEPGSYWSGPPVPAHTDWRDDETIFPLVTDVVNRDNPDADSVAKLNAYIDTIPAEKRVNAIPLLFSALVDQTNDERSILIQRIDHYGRRQRGMGNTITAIAAKVDALPANDPSRPDLAGERDFDIHAFQETQHTMRYACEAPANMDRRLGLFARTLMAKLPSK